MKKQRLGMRNIGAGTQFAALMLSGFFVGYALDVWLGTLPWLMIAVVGMSFARGFHKLYNDAAREAAKPMPSDKAAVSSHIPSDKN